MPGPFLSDQGYYPISQFPQTVKKTRIFLIEDNRLLREGLTVMLDKQADFIVSASAGNSSAVTKATRWKPRVVLLDLGLRTVNSFRLLESLRKAAPDARVIGMDLLPSQEDLVRYVQKGVSGFVLKDATFEDLLSTIHLVAKGGNVLPSPLTGSLFTQIVEHASRNTKSNPFNSVRMTKREREVVALIANEGLSNKEIAQRLHVSTDTVKSHVHNILEKLALHSRLEIASFAHTGDDSSISQRD